jgi:hypothetical protein
MQFQLKKIFADTSATAGYFLTLSLCVLNRCFWNVALNHVFGNTDQLSMDQEHKMCCAILGVKP